MTKNEAVALIKFKAAINEACLELSENLETDNLKWADSYYLTHIRSAANGQGYGSAPVGAAEELLENIRTREKFSKLHQAAFALETVAHTKGLEAMLLPHAEFIRKVDEVMKRWAQAKSAPALFQARTDLALLVEENGGE